MQKRLITLNLEALGKPLDRKASTIKTYLRSSQVQAACPSLQEVLVNGVAAWQVPLVDLPQLTEALAAERERGRRAKAHNAATATAAKRLRTRPRTPTLLELEARIRRLEIGLGVEASESAPRQPTPMQ